MKTTIKVLSVVCFVISMASPWAATETQNLEAGMVNPGYIEKPVWFKLSFMELPEDVQEATRDGKRLILYFYQDGCPYCEKLLHDNFGRQEITDKTRQHFEVIAINMWGDREMVDFKGKPTIEKDFAASMKVMYTPTMLFLNEEAKVVLRINGYYHPQKFVAALDYVSQKQEGKQTFTQFYSSKEKIRESGKLHMGAGYLQPPYNLKQTLATSQKPLLVLFESPNCKLCDELHLDILPRPEPTAAIKEFNVVLLNRYSNGFIVTPEGQSMRIADWANQMNIQHSPSMVFFESSGKEVFRTEAYLRTFHVAGAMTYVSSGKYKTQKSFQRYLQDVNKALTDQGIKVDLMR